MSKDKEDTFVTHDQWKIIMLIYLGHKPIGLEVGPIPGSRSTRNVMHYVFKAECEEDARRWDRGDDTEEMESVRAIKNIMNMFKENLRRYLT